MSLRLPPPTNAELGSDPEKNSSSEDTDDDDQNWDDWVSDSIVQQECRSLFEDKKFTSIEEAVAHDKSAHGFDINHAVKRLCESLSYLILRTQSI